jgi:hypothetical protein
MTFICFTWLAGIAYIESRWQPGVRNPSGAAGLFQVRRPSIMTHTGAADYALALWSARGLSGRDLLQYAGGFRCTIATPPPHRFCP